MLSISRRNLLRAASAGALLAPFSHRFTGVAQAATAPKRLLVVWTANGQVQGNYWPQSGTTSSRILEPLGPHKGDITVVKGVTFGGTGDHKTGMPFCTSGFPQANKGPSIDQEVARITGKPSLVLTGKGKPENYRGYVSYDKSGANVPPIQEPQTAFQTVFGRAPTGGGGTPAPTPAPTPSSGGYDDELQKKILETAVGDIQEIRKRMSGIEQAKMDSQIDALTRMANNLKPAMPGGGGGVVTPSAPIDCKAIDSAPFAASGIDYPTKIKLHIDLIVAAFTCDVNRTASLMFSPGGHDSMNFGYIGVGGGDIHNNVAHHIDDPEKGSGNRETMTKIAVWQAEQIAYLIERLKETPDVDGKRLFDNTVILWTTECMDANHGHQNIPVVVAGGGGKLKLGLNMNMGSGKYNDLLIAVAHAAGHTGLRTFGENGTAPLAAILA